MDRQKKIITPDSLEVEVSRDEDKAFVVSFPKSGRTWLRMLLSRYKQVLLHHPTFHLKLHAYFQREPFFLPQIIFYHARSHPPRVAGRLQRWLGAAPAIGSRNHTDGFDLAFCGRSPIIFLVRDPRDVLVSFFYEMTLRRKRHQGTLDEFARRPDFGIDRIISFLNFVAAEKDQCRSTFLFYEDLWARPQRELRRLLAFMGIPSDEAAIEESVVFASFDNMRKMEMSGSFGEKLSRGDPDDPSSAKVRKGRVGTHREELDDTCLAYVEGRIQNTLDRFYGRYR